MKLKYLLSLLLFFAVAITPCWAHHMAMVVDKQNQLPDISSQQLAKIFRHETTHWPDGTDIVLVLHASSRDESETLQRLNHMSAAQLKAFIQAHKDRIKVVASDADVLDVIGSTPGAIGLVSVRSVNSRVNVVRVNSKLPLEEGYLSHAGN